MSNTLTPFSKRKQKRYSAAATPIGATNARRNFFSLIRQVGKTSIPVQIAGKENSVMMVSLEDWNALQETLYLQSIPGMKASIIKGMAEPISKTVKKLW